MTNWYSLNTYVDNWPKILLFRTHHLWNSTNKLTFLLACIYAKCKLLDAQIKFLVPWHFYLLTSGRRSQGSRRRKKSNLLSFPTIRLKVNWDVKSSAYVCDMNIKVLNVFFPNWLLHPSTSRSWSLSCLNIAIFWQIS